MDVKSRQIDIASDMLKPSTEWKFLIYDNIGQDILSPLFSIKELRSHGVTLHLLINAERDPVPDVAAVYFVMPTEANIERICQDLHKHMYESYYFNFISPISRTKLEAIADAALMSDSATNVKRVYDQYLNFIALEDNMFILREHDKELISYHALHRYDVSQNEITAALDYITECLFSVLVTMNVIPIIRCQSDGPSEVIATKLTAKICEILQDSRSTLFKANANTAAGAIVNTTTTTTASTRELTSFSNLGFSLNRPLLILVDRSFDMSTPLHHTWTYQALIHDVLNIRLNQVKIIETNDKTNKSKTQFYDLNSKDKFWLEQKGGPFPQVADAVQRELDEYRRNEEEVKRLKSTMGLDGGPGDDTLLAESTAKLTSAVSSLPELLENKRVIGMHTTIATSVLEEIKSRKLDNFFETEEKITNRSLVDNATLEDMITDVNYGKPEDKYRLFLISYICDNPTITNEDAERYVSILEGFGCKRQAFDYVRNWKKISNTNLASLQSSLQSSGGVPRTVNMFSKLMSQGSQFVMEGVKNLVLKEHYLPLTKIVDSLMDTSSKASQEAAKYLYIDPKSMKNHDAQRKTTFQDAIVFVVGGGSYVEYQNLVEYSKSKSKGGGLSGSSAPTRRVIYGATDLINGRQFLEQLEKLQAA